MVRRGDSDGAASTWCSKWLRPVEGGRQRISIQVSRSSAPEPRRPDAAPARRPIVK
jgi:hypothetical protein